MHIVLYERGGNAPFEAIAAGCQVAGYRTTWQRPSVWTHDAIVADASVVVVHGLHGSATRIREAYQALGVPVWIVDLPRLRREVGAIGLFRDSVHYLPTTAFRVPVAEPVLMPRGTDVILVAGQKPGDHAHGMDAAAQERWRRETITAIRAVDARPIVYRPHPSNTMPVPSDAYGADAWSDPATVTLRDDFAHAACVVVYNSTVGWDAIAAGVPVIALAPREQVAYAEYVDLAIQSPMIGGQLVASARAEALGRAASTQWTLDELRSGIAQRASFAGEFPPYPTDCQPSSEPALLPPDDGSFVLGESIVGVEECFECDAPDAGAGEAIQEQPAILPPVVTADTAPRRQRRRR